MTCWRCPGPVPRMTPQKLRKQRETPPEPKKLANPIPIRSPEGQKLKTQCFKAETSNRVIQNLSVFPVFRSFSRRTVRRPAALFPDQTWRGWRQSSFGGIWGDATHVDGRSTFAGEGLRAIGGQAISWQQKGEGKVAAIHSPISFPSRLRALRAAASAFEGLPTSDV